MDISFVINSYGRPISEIQASIKSCLAQSKEQFEFEIIFVDQNKIPLVLDQNLDPVNLNHYPTTSISRARNRGALLACGTWLIFVDDDAQLDPAYLQEFFKLQEKAPSCSIWAGTIYIDNDRNSFYSNRQRTSRVELGFLEMKVLMGGNFIIKRDLFAAIGKFDEEFGIGGKFPSSEDTDLAWRIHYAGFPMRLSHDLRVYHPAPQTISMKKAYAYGLGKGALVGKWIFREHKMLTIIELGEMILVPLAKMLLDFKAAPTHFSTLMGRLKGFFRAIF